MNDESRLDARIASNRNPAHRYPSSRRVNGRWADARVRPIMVDNCELGRSAPTIEIGPSVSEHLARVKRDDRRLTAIMLLAAAALIAGAVLLFVVAPQHAPRPCPLTAAHCAPTTDVPILP